MLTLATPLAEMIRHIKSSINTHNINAVSHYIESKGIEQTSICALYPKTRKIKAVNKQFVAQFQQEKNVFAVTYIVLSISFSFVQVKNFHKFIVSTNSFFPPNTKLIVFHRNPTCIALFRLKISIGYEVYGAVRIHSYALLWWCFIGSLLIWTLCISPGFWNCVTPSVFICVCAEFSCTIIIRKKSTAQRSRSRFHFVPPP